jgi:hypothetical protein
MLKAVQAGVLTVDEAREAIGYDEMDVSDDQPETVQRASALLGYGIDTKASEPPKDDDAMTDILREYLGGNGAGH